MTERDIFLAAIDLVDPTERATFVEKACGGDPVLRAKIGALLHSHDSAGSFLVRPAVAAAEPANAATEIVDGESTPHDATVTHDGQSRFSDEQSEATSFLSPSTRPDSLGRIGHYEVLQVLGKGGFGIVFRAFDDVLQRVVAVKVMAPQLAATSPARKRFLREARSSAQVRHENVVQVYEIGELPLPYLAMEFIPGETLQQRLDRTGPLEVMEVVRLGRQIAEGLAAAHATDLIHRDIKPSNILIEAGQQKAKLTDFGLARAADDASISQSGIIAGTPMFMAPEQALGHKLDQRADLFSLGSVLYQMAAGRPPFRANSTVAVLKRVAEDQPRDIREIIPETPQWLCNIIAKLHEKKPEDRYQSAREVADVLADCEHQLKQHGALRDYSKIPGGKLKARRLPVLSWKRAAALVLIPLITLGVVIASKRGWENTYRYVTNQSGLVVEVGDPYVELVIITKDGVEVERIGSGLAIRSYPPGEYQIQVMTATGYRPDTLYFEASGFGGPNGTWTTNPTNGRYPVGLGRGSKVKVRATAVAVTDDGFTPLFDGKTLTGWKKHAEEPGDWVVEKGILIGRAGRSGYLLTERGDFENFHLRAELKLNSGGDSGLFVRTQPGSLLDSVNPNYPFKKGPPGYEVQISQDSVSRTGSLMLVQEGKEPGLFREERELAPPGHWFVLEVTADGPWLRVKVNGEQTVYMKNEAFARGHIALQMWNDQTDVQFRKIEIKELPPSSDSFTPLFNGTDLTGWEGDKDVWQWRDGTLVGILLPRHGKRNDFLRSSRQYKDFEMKFKVRLKGGEGNSGVQFRSQVDATKQPDIVTGPQLDIGAGWWGSIYHEGPGGLFKQANQIEVAKVLKSSEFNDMSIKVAGHHVTVTINGLTAINGPSTQLPLTPGVLAFQLRQYNDRPIEVTFKDVFIREISPASPEVPSRASDILTFIRGIWKRNSVLIEPKPPADKARSSGQLTFEPVASGKVMRGLSVDENGRPVSLVLHSYDAASGRLSSWFLTAEGETTSSRAGVYDPTSRTFSWWETFPDGSQSYHKLDFADANTVRSRTYDSDATSKIVYESQATYTRTNQPAATPSTALDPNRPAEMKVLDRLVGEWRNDLTVANVATPDRPQSQVQRTKANAILGGRFVEVIDTDEATGAANYALAWFDPAAKKYRQWYFNGTGGETIEFTGTWDETATTLSWNTADNRLEGRWVFKSDDLREFRHDIKGADGKVINRAEGLARRVTANTLPPTFKNSIGMEFAIVPKGKSWLGGRKDKLGDKEVEIPADFYLGKYEVTQEEWEKVMGENPSHFSRNGEDKDAVKDIPDADLKRFPVEKVSWDMAQLFVAKLNQREKETGWVYRLPKVAEWEYACRGGPMADKAVSAFDFYLDKPSNTLLPGQANFQNDMGRTCKVGSYAPNRLGLYDMHGNIAEWCHDLENEGAARRVFRGMSWRSAAAECRAAHGAAHVPSFQNRFHGLRLARVPAGGPSPEAKTPSVAVAPFTDADVQRISALPAGTQVAQVRKELMRRNPGFDGAMEHKIEGGVVTELRIVADKMTDIAPIRVFNALQSLTFIGTKPDISGTKHNGLLADLTPLKGMNLGSLTSLNLQNTQVGDSGLALFKDCKKLTKLSLQGTQVSDSGLAHFKDRTNLTNLNLQDTQVSDSGLAHFKDCKSLTSLNFGYTSISDAGLSHFKDCKNLRSLQLGGTQVSDAGLAHFKNCKALTRVHLDSTSVSDVGLANFLDMKLRVLRIDNNCITDVSPLQSMPLEEILLTPRNVIKGLDILRDMKSLKSIGIEWDQSWPAAEFWKRYDKGEFK